MFVFPVYPKTYQVAREENKEEEKKPPAITTTHF
jgi:hypothetical protein